MRFRPKFVRKFFDFDLVLFGYYENQGKLAYMIKEKKNHVSFDSASISHGI